VRVLMLIDELFAARERSMLRRLSVGLTDEGVSVVHAVPEHAAGCTEAGGLLAAAVTFPMGGPFLTRAMRARRLIANLRDHDESSTTPRVDVVHAFGGSVWDLAIQTAHELAVPVVLDIWRRGLVERARLMRPQFRATPGLLLMAPDQSVERTLAGDLPDVPVRTAPWGVHRAPRPREIFQESRAASVFLAGNGREAAVFHAGFEGITLALGAARESVIFADAEAAERSKLWRVAERLGVLDRLSLIPEMEGRRDLVILGDAIVQPESLGEQRSLLLDAMGQGMVVGAGYDPDVSWLQPGRTAAVLDRAAEPTSPDAWGDLLRPVLTDPARARQLGERAWQYVGAQHRASSHVAAVLDAYEWLVAKEPIPYPGTGVRPASGS